ncbi:MAG: hypothetical protein WB498_09435, partial [Candidatus Binatus sp.]
MARKPGKPIRRKRTTKAKRDSKAGGEARRGRAIAEPIAPEKSASDLDLEAGLSAEAADENAPIEVSEFHPVAGADDEAAAEPVAPADSEADAAQD